jgi:activating signal cointegrator complex subunit 3
VNILLQTYIGGGSPVAFSLVSDMAYVAQNAARILRGLFEITLRRNWASLTQKLLTLCKMLDRRLWDFQSPLHQVGLFALIYFIFLLCFLRCFSARLQSAVTGNSRKD